MSGSDQQLRSGRSGPLRGQLRVPGDKSISHRSIMLGALAEGTTQVRGLLMGEDVRATIAAFQAMGVTININDSGDGRIIGVGKTGLRQPSAPLDMGNSGTAMRLLAGILAGQPFRSELVGDESLMVRPMRRVVDPLLQMGADISARDERLPPLSINSVASLKGQRYDSPVASAQVKSCVLLAGLYAGGTTRVQEPRPTRDHSERMLRAFGADIDYGDGWAEISGESTLAATDIEVPGDISSAAFWLVAASLVPDSDITLVEVGINRRRAGILSILRAMGANLELLNQRELGGEPVADIRVRSATLKGVEIDSAWVPDAIDEFPVVFVAASCAQGTTVLRGAEELRVKESDRIAVMARGLATLGVQLEEHADGITIHGGNQGEVLAGGGTVDSEGDHRCAMAFAVAGMMSAEPVTVADCANIATSYPAFIEHASSLGAAVEPASRSAPVITIDGPSGSGKGTISARVAAAMGWHFLDSGALYRLVGLAALEAGVDLDNEAKLAELAANMQVKFDFLAAEPFSIILDNQPVGDKIRDERVALAASKVAVLPAVRQALLQLQRDFRQLPGLVADGRDMGTVVFTDAPHKIFLTASPEERAKRRYKQLKDKDNGVTLRALSDEIRARDERDSSRAVAPLKPAADAIVIDTTESTIEQVVDRVLGLLR